jgi:hypothetical protein
MVASNVDEVRFADWDFVYDDQVERGSPLVSSVVAYCLADVLGEQ